MLSVSKGALKHTRVSGWKFLKCAASHPSQSELCRVHLAARALSTSLSRALPVNVQPIGSSLLATAESLGTPLWMASIIDIERTLFGASLASKSLQFTLQLNLGPALFVQSHLALIGFLFILFRFEFVSVSFDRQRFDTMSRGDALHLPVLDSDRRQEVKEDRSLQLLRFLVLLRCDCLVFFFLIFELLVVLLKLTNRILELLSTCFQ